MKKINWLAGIAAILLQSFSTLSAQPTYMAGLNLDVSASYLYWGAQEDQLGFAIEDVFILIGGMESHATLRTFNPSWNSGVRLAAAVGTDCSDFSGKFAWTHFNTDSHASAITETPGVPSIVMTTIAGFSNTGSPFLFAETADSRWWLNMNEYTADIGYHGWATPQLNVVPYLGLYGATVNQRQYAAYTDVPFDATTIDLSVFRLSDFWGVGPRLGTHVSLPLCWGLSLVSDIGGAYLIGKFNTTNVITATAGFEDRFADVLEKLCRIRPMVNGYVGFDWHSNCFKCAEVYLGVGYEFQYWWRQWHSCSNILDGFLSGEGRWGDLSVHGLVINAGVEF